MKFELLFPKLYIYTVVPQRTSRTRLKCGLFAYVQGSNTLICRKKARSLSEQAVHDFLEEIVFLLLAILCGGSTLIENTILLPQI